MQPHRARLPGPACERSLKFLYHPQPHTKHGPPLSLSSPKRKGLRGRGMAQAPPMEPSPRRQRVDTGWFWWSNSWSSKAAEPPGSPVPSPTVYKIHSFLPLHVEVMVMEREVDTASPAGSLLVGCQRPLQPPWFLQSGLITTLHGLEGTKKGPPLQDALQS